MQSKINYFMGKDTRLIVDNLRKVIINENELLVYCTIQRRSFKDIEIIAVDYIVDKNIMIIYDNLKKHNSKVYEGFIEWANKKGIEISKQKFREES